MEIYDLERLSITKETYDCDSDSEDYADHAIDDEPLNASIDIPKLQFRKVASKAQWIDELGMAVVIEKKGKLWTTTGIVRGGRTYCSVEETLFLAEIGALNVMNFEGTHLLLADLYRKVGKESDINSCSWESFEVYRHLKFLGYIVGHHGIPWSLKNVKTDATAREGVLEFDGSRAKGPVSSSFLNENLSSLKLENMKPMLEVYLPNSKFKKSSPGNPSFLLCVIRGHPPSKQEMENLEACCGEIPIKLCVVEHGRISFFSFTKVDLPVLS